MSRVRQRSERATTLPVERDARFSGAYGATDGTVGKSSSRDTRNESVFHASGSSVFTAGVAGGAGGSGGGPTGGWDGGSIGGWDGGWDAAQSSYA